MNRIHRHTAGPRQRGLTLIELMVGLVIGLVILAATSAAFVTSSNSRREMEISADVIEGGRYAVDILSRELGQAGYYGTLAVPTGPGDLTKLCSTSLADWSNSLQMHVAGWNNADANPSCLPDRKPGTAAILVQRVSTCMVGDVDCEPETADDAYLQVSECGSEYTVTPFVLGQGTAGSGVFKLSTSACNGVTTVGKRKFIRRIFYVDGNSVLNYRDVHLTGVSDPVPLVENIEQMHFEYAIDSTLDGTPDSFASAPATLTDWSNAIGVRVWLMARSTDTSHNANNALSVQMGDFAYTVAAAGANQKRRLYNSFISFVTPKSRRES
jgi:type IV pilus assembly protein PilW